jgi:hypothetical protein
LLFAYLRSGLAVFRTLWPEMLMSAAVVGVFLGGPSPIGAALLGAGVGLRIIRLGAGTRRVLAGRLARAGASPSGDGSTPLPPPPVSP